MIKLSKKLARVGAAAIFCLSMAQALPVGATSDNPRTNITADIWYNNISTGEYAFSTPKGCIFTVVQTGNGIGKAVYNFYPEPGMTSYEALDKAWMNFNGSNNTLINAAYLQYAMKTLENPYLYEVADHCRLILLNVADGGVDIPNHFDEFAVYNLVDDVGMLAAIAKVDNGKGVEFNVVGGPAWIKGTEVRVREYPNTDCAVLGYFENREEIDVIGYVKSNASVPNPGDWAYVRRPNGQLGYVAAQFVTKNDVVVDYEDYLRNHLRNSGKYNSWQGINYKLMIVDCYSGEGPRATSTQIIKVYEDMGTHTATMGTFHVCSNGQIMKYDVATDSLKQDN